MPAPHPAPRHAPKPASGPAPGGARRGTDRRARTTASGVATVLLALSAALGAGCSQGSSTKAFCDTMKQYDRQFNSHDNDLKSVQGAFADNQKLLDEAVSQAPGDVKDQVSEAADWFHDLNEQVQDYTNPKQLATLQKKLDQMPESVTSSLQEVDTWRVANCGGS